MPRESSLRFIPAPSLSFLVFLTPFLVVPTLRLTVVQLEVSRYHPLVRLIVP